jgi:hypothetical protein
MIEGIYGRRPGPDALSTKGNVRLCYDENGERKERLRRPYHDTV